MRLLRIGPAGGFVARGPWLSWRQDMRYVPALGQKVDAILSRGSHGLRPDDGHLISDLVRSLRLGG